MPKDKGEADPNEGLADDATLASDLGDEGKRRDDQLEYYGGDKDATDTDDLSDLDRGDVVGEPEPKDDEDKGDEDDETEEKEDDEASEDEDGAEDDGDADADSDDDAEADDDADGDSDSDSDDSDGDETDEADDADESDADEKDSRGIPRHRFKEVNARMKTAEGRLAVLEKTSKAEDDAAEDKFDFDAAEKEYIDLTLDGKTEEATSKRREIRAAEKVEFVAAAKAETKTEVNEESIQRTGDDLAPHAEEMFPVFKPKHDDYNPDMVRKVSTFMRGYQADGLKGDDALVAAIADVAELYKLNDTESPSDEDTEDDGDKKPTKKKVAVKKGKKINKTKEKLKLAEQQQRSPAGEGKGSSEAGAVVPDIDQMTDEEIDALPAETLSRIRGDYVE